LGVEQLLDGGMYMLMRVRESIFMARYSICGSLGGSGRVWNIMLL